MLANFWWAWRPPQTFLSNAECTSRLVKWTSGALVMICVNIEYVFVGNKTECSRIFGGPGGPQTSLSNAERLVGLSNGLLEL